MNARRAVLRWAWRLFRREWRQQSLVLALLTLAVAAAVAGTTVAYNLTAPRGADFGSADHKIRLDGGDPRALAASTAEIRKAFGTIDVLAYRTASIPGSVETVKLRAQDPHGPYGAPLLRLRKGRYPAAAGEIAVTDSVAASFRTGLGGRFALDGRPRTVVGLVENPSDLHDEFALVPPGQNDPAESVTVLVKGSRAQLLDLNRSAGGIFDSRDKAGRGLAATGGLVASTVGLLLVSLIAAAGFVVVAQRRLRQLGMMASIGATQKHLRLVTLANGALVGVIAAVLGGVAGLAGWIVAGPALEGVAAHRIDRLDIPWPQVGIGILLAVCTATAASWWPARTISRVPVVQALSARPVRPKPAHRSAVVAVLLLAAGAGCLVLFDQKRPPFLVAGILCTVLGILFIGPLAIRSLAAGAARAPIAVRLALRDLARHQSRSGAALAAISLALGISAAILVTTAAAEPAPDEGNLSDRQILLRVGNTQPHLTAERTPAQLEKVRAQIDRFAATLADSSVYALDRPVETNAPREPGEGDQEGGLVSVAIVTQKSARSFADVPAFVATPELLRHYRVNADPGAELFTVRDFKLQWLSTVERKEPGNFAKVQHLDVPKYSSAPNTLVSAETVRRYGWKSVRAAWFVESSRPLTEAQRTEAREMARAAGLTVETRRDTRTTMAAIRSGATVAGVLLALGILAMTIGLIRGETGRDLRALTAAGATGLVRRTLAATTAGALALLGAALGTLGAYLAITAGYHSDLDRLGNVPVLHLTVLAAGLPLLAGVAGWLLSGREPTALTRQPID